MAAILVGQIAVKNESLWAQYVAGVSKSLIPYDASIVFRGDKTSVLAGENETDLIVIISFKSSEALNEWFQSDLYRSLIWVRDQAADVIITTYV